MVSMKKHNKSAIINPQPKTTSRLKNKVVLLIIFQCCMVFLLSCSNDDGRPLRGSIILGDAGISGTVYCSLDLDKSSVQNIDEIRIYNGSEDNVASSEITWGFSTEEINLNTEFIKEENLIDFGIEIISLSEDRRVFTIKYLQGFNGIFLGYKVVSQKKAWCNTSFYQESVI